VHVPDSAHLVELQDAHVQLMGQLSLLNSCTVLCHNVQRLGHDEVSVNVALELVSEESNLLVMANRHLSSLDFENSKIFNELFFVSDFTNLLLV